MRLSKNDLKILRAALEVALNSDPEQWEALEEEEQERAFDLAADLDAVLDDDDEEEEADDDEE